MADVNDLSDLLKKCTLDATIKPLCKKTGVVVSKKRKDELIRELIQKGVTKDDIMATKTSDVKPAKKQELSPDNKETGPKAQEPIINPTKLYLYITPQLFDNESVSHDSAEAIELAKTHQKEVIDWYTSQLTQECFECKNVSIKPFDEDDLQIYFEVEEAEPEDDFANSEFWDRVHILAQCMSDPDDDGNHLLAIGEKSYFVSNGYSVKNGYEYHLDPADLEVLYADT